MVDFLIIGTQKGGTSSLDYYLRQHPDVGMGDKKELHYFDNEEIFANPTVDYTSYESQFGEDGHKVHGEATPIYMYWKPCCERIRDYNKDMKLIMVLRDPSERAFSHWNMEYDRGAEQEDFGYCTQNESERLKEYLPSQHRVYSYIDRGFYSVQLKRIYDLFPKNQLMVIKYETFVTDQEQVLNQLFEFIGVDPGKFNFEPKIIRAGNASREMSVEERSYLVEVFKDDIVELERMLNWDCKSWLV